MKKSKEEKINNFLDELFSERAPDYSGFEREEGLVEIAEISLFLKKDISEDDNFKAELFEKLSREFEERNSRCGNKRHRSILFNLLSVGISFYLIMLVFNPFVFYFHKTPHKINSGKGVKQRVLKQNIKSDIVKVTSYRISDKKTLRLLYNERNNVILYWPFGQLAIFQ